VGSTGLSLAKNKQVFAGLRYTDKGGNGSLKAQWTGYGTVIKRAPCSSLRLPCTFGVLPGLGRSGKAVFLLIVRSSSPI